LVIQQLLKRIRNGAASLFKESLDPGHAGTAVFLGIFIGIVPIYGFQTLVAVGLALLFKLNKPLVVAATFINNPFLQPAIVISSLEVGYFLRYGHYHQFAFSGMTVATMRDNLMSWFLGSIVVGAVIGGMGAFIMAVAVHLESSENAGMRARLRLVNQSFDQSPRADRYFVWWKLRLDKMFGILAAEDLGSGTVVDLGCGCGYSMALCDTVEGEPGRRMVGCDLNAHRISVARQALRSRNVEVSVQDVRDFQLPSAGLILILDVLQYLPAEEQVALLKRCCSALDSQGRLIVRAHDRDRGLWSAITLALDKLLFTVQHAGTRPLILSALQYQHVLEEAGMQVETRRFRNHLPLSHILFIAKRPLAESAS
jgi:uncharacterized protein (DUF2062 family)/trans-aconitate methyltransferase